VHVKRAGSALPVCRSPDVRYDDVAYADAG